MMNKQHTEVISSVQNPRVKAWTQLLDKKGRDKQGQFIIEGVHLVQEALSSGANLHTIVYAHDRREELPGGLLRQAVDLGIDCVAVSQAVLGKCTDTLAPQAVFAVLPKLGWGPEELLAPTGPALVVAIDGIQDPGNLGTIIRSADAVGATGVLLGKGTVDLYNPKTVRSTMGSMFHLPITQGDLLQLLPRAAEAGIAVVTTSLQGTTDCYSFDFRRPVWFVIGNEGQGVSAGVSDLTTEHIRIPMRGLAESLNAAMAATVVLFEAMRQRMS
ncbi:TrmH family RNA methyltransferase [Paenibacillus xerothermodurans]|uniref:RNA methyltransferase n=1 Tax=Paenibacillus xerothermodurans TaxID=1977292 RepID=A0A2W1P0E0_PAEXE|nr:RNA methyltransferase [Paenibacillus xerothermodurans]PZE21212.1 RNA methyltransferase [Paenibacillus xerothermodurans]